MLNSVQVEFLPRLKSWDPFSKDFDSAFGMLIESVRLDLRIILDKLAAFEAPIKICELQKIVGPNDGRCASREWLLSRLGYLDNQGLLVKANPKSVLLSDQGRQLAASL